MSRKPKRSLSVDGANCPAASLARLIGQYNAKYLYFDRLSLEVKEARDVDGNHFKRASDAAYTFENAYRRALVTAPVRSISGAIAKIIMAIDFIREEQVNELDDSEICLVRQSAELLIDDAIQYFSQAMKISPSSVGLESYYSPHLYPRERLRKGEQVAAKRAVRGCQ